MKLAFVYDRLNKLGGAERVLQALHDLWPAAPWYTAVHNPATASFTRGWDVRTSFMQYVPLAKTHHQWFPWLTPFAFESFSFDGFDTVISITSAEAKGIITQPATLHLCYCLTPTRYLWSHSHEYGYPLLLSKLRQWDYVAAQRPDRFLAISRSVQDRIRKYYHRDSDVIYPGIDTNFFVPGTSHQPLATSYFLVVSRLVAYKHIDLAIRACNQLKLPLKIVGSGSEFNRLQSLAGPTVELLGQLTDEQLLGYYQGCRALIFPGEEDFGLTMLEALSCGKPVIAFARGGASEIITAGTTGQFFDTLNTHSLVQALTQFDPTVYDPTIIRHHALKFSLSGFKRQFKSQVVTLWQQHQSLLP